MAIVADNDEHALTIVRDIVSHLGHQLAHVGANMHGALGLKPTRHFGAGCLVDDARQHPAHPARCPGDC